MKISDIDELKKKANEIRIGIIEAVHGGKSGHPGGSLSCADILTVLYFNQMHIDPAKPNDESRDRFILSKGHAAPALYSTLANRGYFCTDDLCNLRHIDEEIAKRKAVAERYREHLDGVAGIQLNKEDPNVQYNYAYFPVVFEEKEFGSSRTEVFDALAANGIGARKYFHPFFLYYLFLMFHTLKLF